MSKQADFKVTTYGDPSRDPAGSFQGDFYEWLAANGMGGGSGGNGGGFPWFNQSSPTTPTTTQEPPKDTSQKAKKTMTGAETALLIAQLAGPMMAGLFGGDDSPRQSFEGSGAVDPRNLMRSNLDLATRYGQAMTDHLARPISLPSAYVQTPGAYSGGGLPMPIGISAEDPALANPSLLSRPGLTEFENLFSGLSGTPYAGGMEAPGVSPDGYTDTDPYDTTRQAVPKDDAIPSLGEQASSGPRRRSAVSAASGEDYGQLVRAEDLIDGNAPGDDLSKALGSVQLLLEAYR